jgi:hypothetical protein
MVIWNKFLTSNREKVNKYTLNKNRMGRIVQSIILFSGQLERKTYKQLETTQLMVLKFNYKLEYTKQA